MFFTAASLGAHEVVVLGAAGCDHDLLCPRVPLNGTLTAGSREEVHVC